ncbi:unnamed protein product [Calypogeia fissa]
MIFTRDHVMEWAVTLFTTKFGLKLEQVKALSRSTFLLVFENKEAQCKVLEDAPYYMNRKMVLVTPWDLEVNMESSQPFHAPVWIDLLTVDPTLEIYANELLGKAGKVIYAATSYARSRYSNICGCVQMDLSKPLKKFVTGRILGIQSFKIGITYRALPTYDMC